MWQVWGHCVPSGPHTSHLWDGNRRLHPPGLLEVRRAPGAEKAAGDASESQAFAPSVMSLFLRQVTTPTTRSVDAGAHPVHLRTWDETGSEAWVIEARTRDAAARPASALPLWRPARARATVDFVLTPRFTFLVTLYAGPSPETPGTAAGVGPSDAAPPPASCATSLLVRC